MKRLIVILALILSPALLFAQAGSDVVITEQGTIYAIHSVDVRDDSSVETTSRFALSLSIQNGAEISEVWIPETLLGGTHSNASLAWDDESDTLYAFWVRMPNPMSTELLFASYKDGVWSNVTSIENSAFRYRTNLQITVTDWAWEEQTDPDTGELRMTRVEAPSVHVVWWDESGVGESARYALIALTDGTISNIQVADLTEFLTEESYGQPSILDPDFNRDFFRHPSIETLDTNDGIRLVFAQTRTDKIHRVDVPTLSLNSVLRIPIPRLNGVLRIPIPARTMDPPTSLVANSMSDVETITGEGDDTLITFMDDGAMKYIRHEDGAWTDLRTIALHDNVTRDSATAALHKLMSRR